MSGLKATGGGDFPEDMAGAFDVALKLDWSSKSKYAILIADAPCHGKKYHDSHSDDYPNGDPNGLNIENLVKEFANKKISLNAVTIHAYSTDKMYSIFNRLYEEISKVPIAIANLGNSTKDFNFFVTESVKSSISRSESKSSSSLMNKLISLSASNQYEVIDSVISMLNE